MKITPNLTGVPETMLWTLYNRAGEARRKNGILRDSECLRIFDSIDYDFRRSFGNPDAAHAVRSLESDRLLRDWMAKHPSGTVVSLGEGLETQSHRVDDGQVHWISVDLPEAIEIRERFLSPSERRQHLAMSALDSAWMDEVDANHPVFIVAQGLFMYFEERDVRTLIHTMTERFRRIHIFFDVIPRWASTKTLKGLKRTPHYTLPRMPWGIDIDEIEDFLRSCSTRPPLTKIISYRLPRGLLRLLIALFGVLPTLRTKLPVMVSMQLPNDNDSQKQ